MPKKANTDILSRISKILICVTVFLLALIVILVTAINEENNRPYDAVRFLDVGQGDSILITSNDEAALIDTSTPTKGMDIAKKLYKYGVDGLNALVITHPHNDHMGGADYLLSEFEIHNIVISDSLPKSEGEAKMYHDIKMTALGKSIPIHTATEGMVINVGNFVLTVLMSDETADDENDRSIIIMAENKGRKFLLMGDAEQSAEEKLIKDNINFDCDVLKVGHHGSSAACSENFLKIATPAFAAVSVGADNAYGHPANETLVRLQSVGCTVLRTDLYGDITFILSDDGTLALSKEGKNENQ